MRGTPAWKAAMGARGAAMSMSVDTIQKEETKMLTIKVLGPGCDNCHRVEAIARQALIQIGAEAEVIKVTDYGEIKKYPIVATPGLVINENLVCAGRIPSAAEVVTWLATALSAEAN